MKRIAFYVLSLALVLGMAVPEEARADQLVLHFIRSPKGMRWRAPHTLAQSVLVNTVATMLGGHHSIGHVQTEVRCEGSDGQPAFYQASGMSSTADNTDQDLILKQKIGLSVLFFNFDGHFEKDEEVFEDLRVNYATGKTNFITFEISPSTCRRLQQYVTEYEAREYWRSYGLPNRPRHGEGAGCSAYGASFVDVGGLMLPEFETKWTRYRRVPQRYMGGWLNPGTNVNVFKLAASLASRWARAEEPHLEIAFWDPDRMNHWVRRTFDAIQGGMAHLGYPTQVLRNGKGYGLWIDLRSRMTPTDAIWKHEGSALAETARIRQLSQETEADLRAEEAEMGAISAGELKSAIERLGGR